MLRVSPYDATDLVTEGLVTMVQGERRFCPLRHAVREHRTICIKMSRTRNASDYIFFSREREKKKEKKKIPFILPLSLQDAKCE